jgi:hypothetical protein
MWIQEIEFDISQDPVVCLSEGGFQNVGEEASVAELRIAAEQEFGNFIENITDSENNDAPIGWKFRTQATYEDPDNGTEFELETWVVLHDQPPEMQFKYHFIKDEELAVLEHVNSLIANMPQPGFEDDDEHDTPLSVPDDILSRLDATPPGTLEDNTDPE